MMKTMPRVAILIRTFNEQARLGAVLDAILAQDLTADEILVLDSGSSDGTREVAQARGPRVRVELLDVPFSYGRALNRGFAMLSADTICCVSGHSVPRDGAWLRSLLAPLSDPRVAAVYGRQLPHPDCVPWEAYSVLGAFGPAARLQSDDPFFSNANSAVRRSAWAAHPFDELLPTAEDQKFAVQVQSEGGLIAYAPEAAVYHSHNETFSRVRERTENEARALATFSRFRWPGTWRALVRCGRGAALRYRHVIRTGAFRADALLGPALYEIARFRGERSAVKAGSCSN
ncbi:MAG: glycosyltransferase [Planctomycetes bacterium]|nr:glycosyltransferase [Planctomycetota bacterium]